MTLVAIQNWGNVLASPGGLSEALAKGALGISVPSLSTFQIANGYQMAALAALPAPPRQILCGIAGRSLALESAKTRLESYPDEGTGSIWECLLNIGDLHAKLPPSLFSGAFLPEGGISPEDAFRRSMEIYWGALLQNADIISAKTIDGWTPTPATIDGFIRTIATLAHAIWAEHGGILTASRLLALGTIFALPDTDTGQMIGEIARTLLGRPSYRRGIVCKLHDDDVVEYALAHREEIARIIVDALRRIYPDRDISEPYL